MENIKLGQDISIFSQIGRKYTPDFFPKLSNQDDKLSENSNCFKPLGFPVNKMKKNVFN